MTIEDNRIYEALYLDPKADSQLIELRLKLVDRYKMDSFVGCKSEHLLQFVHSDDEVYLYCSVYLKVVKYDEKKMFSLLFTYPEVVRFVRRLRD